MNKSVKILLLFVAIIIAIGGVLLFMKTIVSPPRVLNFNNQYESALNRKIEDLRQIDPDNLEGEFAALTDFAHRLKAESNIDEQVFDKEYTEIIGVYSPKFAQFCFGQFRESFWDDKELEWMEERIAQLRNLTVENGSHRIMDDYSESDDEFSIIINTIDKYHDAKVLSNRTSYAGLSEARSRIAKANQYTQDNLLSNNISLMNALNSLPGRLEASHYAFLRSRVSSLRNYSSYSEYSYNALSDNVMTALKEYKQNAQSVYGKSRDLSDLGSEASRYEYAANEYFNN